MKLPGNPAIAVLFALCDRAQGPEELKEARPRAAMAATHASAHGGGLPGAGSERICRLNATT